MAESISTPTPGELLQKLFLFFTPAEAESLNDRIKNAPPEAQAEILSILLAGEEKQDGLLMRIFERDPSFAETLKTYMHDLNIKTLKEAESNERESFETQSHDIS